MSEVLSRLKSALADRYVIERELGRGGMATVYLAEDLKHAPTRGRGLAEIRWRPEFSVIRSDARFRELVRTIGLEK